MSGTGSSRKSMHRGVRLCSRSGCRNIASRTLIYIYSESTAVLGPLATFAEPHTYDLCELHSLRMSVPVGWTIINKVVENLQTGPSTDDLMAIADAIREVGKRPEDEPEDNPVASQPAKSSRDPRNNELGRRGHLRAIPN